MQRRGRRIRSRKAPDGSSPHAPSTMNPSMDSKMIDTTSTHGSAKRQRTISSGSRSNTDKTRLGADLTNVFDDDEREPVPKRLLTFDESPDERTQMSQPAQVPSSNVQLPTRPALTVQSLPTAIQEHPRLKKAAQFFAAELNEHGNEFDDQEWTHLKSLFHVACFNVAVEARRNPSVFRLTRKVQGRRWNNEDKSARPYAFVLRMLYPDNVSVEKTQAILRDAWSKTHATIPQAAHMPETLSAILCNPKPIDSIQDVQRTVRTEPPIPHPIQEKDVKMTLDVPGTSHVSTQSAATEQMETRPQDQDRITIPDDGHSDSDNSIATQSVIRPQSTDKFLDSPWTWGQVAQCIPPGRSLAVAISWYDTDPRDFDYTHLCDDTQARGTAQYQAVINRIDTLQQNAEAERERRRLTTPLDSRSMSDTETEMETRQRTLVANRKLGTLLRRSNVISTTEQNDALQADEELPIVEPRPRQVDEPNTTTMLQRLTAFTDLQRRHIQARVTTASQTADALQAAADAARQERNLTMTQSAAKQRLCDALRSAADAAKQDLQMLRQEGQAMDDIFGTLPE